MRPKPAYRALHDLIQREWRTTAQAVTDGDVFFRLRGFHGTYRVQTDSSKADAGIETAISLTCQLLHNIGVHPATSCTPFSNW